MKQPLLANRTYLFLFALLAPVYIIGLFVPLMDNDSAHHAGIGLHMYLTGDYVTLIDQQGDYIDKPHFLFWVSALSYHVFGVSSFAYKFPSFLFTLAGIYSVFRLAKELYNYETGKLAALIYASSFCILLASNDVRMDAILTAAISFALWQLVAYVHHKKFIYLTGAALGLAVGFATKGHVGLVTPVAGIFFYILYKKEWRLLYDWRWLILIFLFSLFISPVVYCYYLQFNLHPEKISRGIKGINGVKYILWGHSFERISGSERFGAAGKEDKFYFLHTFLWTFAPWCLAAYIAFFLRIKNVFLRNTEWLSTGIFLLLGLLINFSNFKLSHYLVVLAPATALMAAHFFVSVWNNERLKKRIFLLQTIASFLVLLLAVIVNAWAFPVKSFLLIAVTILLLATVFYFFISRSFSAPQKAVTISASSMVLLFFLLNSNFYPQLLTYQGGKPLADMTKGIVNPKDVYFWKNTSAPSYSFYSSSLRQDYDDSLIGTGRYTWLLYQKSQQAKIDSAGFIFGKIFSAADYEITRLKKNFINPATRKETLDEMILAEVKGKK